MFTIGVRYCGGCNPQIDRSRVVKNLEEGFRKRDQQVTFTTEKERLADVTLLMNGCKHGCLDASEVESDCGHPVISVRGEMVDDQYVEEADIVKSLVQKISSLL